MDYMDPYCYNNVPGTDVPLDHIDYGYVNSCSDASELGKMLKILRSGKQGHYPELIVCIEKRLSEVDPTNKLLIKNKPAQRMTDLSHEECVALNKDMEDWTENMRQAPEPSDDLEDQQSLPPVRKVTFADSTKGQSSTHKTTTDTKAQRIKSSDYEGWSKFDVEKEVTNVDSKTSQVPTTNSNKPNFPTELTERECALSSEEKELMANREREKGNEAFRAGDMEEAFSYYTRSINFNPSVAAYNNRAFTEIKLKRYQDAVNDCNRALKMDTTNTKSLFRRGTAYSQLNKLHQAATDFERVLHFEPNNKKAQQELNQVRRKLAETRGQEDDKKNGHRIQIEEVEENEETVNETTPTPSVSEATPTPPINETTPTPSVSEATPTPPVNKTTPTPVKKVPPPLPDKVQSLKDNGNRLFQAGQYSDALEKYNEAIVDLRDKGKEQEANLSMLLNNRAACQLKLGNCPAVVTDCTESLTLVALNVKALMRRGTAYEHMEKYMQAYNDFQLALSINRSLSQAYEGSNRITRMLSDQYGSGWRDKLPECPEAVRIRQELQLTSNSFPVVSDSPSDNPERNQPLDEPQLSTSEGGVASQTADEPADDGGNKTALENNADSAQQNAELVQHNMEQDADSVEQNADSAEHPSLPESISSEGTNTDSSSYNASVEESSEEMPSEPTISITSPTSQIKVTQSTQPIPSARTTPPSQKVKDDLLSPEEKFERHKLKGNEHMRKGEFVEALHCYTTCVGVSPGNVVGYTNRALCHLKLSSPRNAEQDCNKALSYEPGNVKALYRRGLARKGLGRYAEAVKDIHLLLTIDPDNQTAKKELAETKQLWEKQLREIQARTPSKDTRPERRNPKTKTGKKSKDKSGPQSPAAKDGPNKLGSRDGPSRVPSKEELEKFQKLLKELEESKEKMEQLQKMGPSGLKWGASEDGPGGLPFTGPPRTTPGKATNGGRKTTKTGGKQHSTTKPKTKKVSKKPPKTMIKPEPLSEESTEMKSQSSPTMPDTKNSTVREGKRIVIEEIDTSDEDGSELTTPPLVVAAPTLKDNTSTEPDTPPLLRTPFEFAQRWNAIPRTAKSSEYARLLEAVPPSTLPSVITNKLDGTMLTNIIQAIDQQFVPKGKYKLSADVLMHLSKVPRFGMVAMFMGQQEKTDLDNVLTALAQSPADISTTSLDQIRQSYCL